ncbi:hypothetical protein EV146_102160 [Mesobacillus foraminis]|uniref:Uncharacterized protein n=1 Tax=Mesobacillus foraminis TaxID=279826 RepID=A0A4R2BME7_9BACI|nr:hypothetical protein EV146_102160 [Mesobacillus foraminis]
MKKRHSFGVFLVWMEVLLIPHTILKNMYESSETGNNRFMDL